MKREDITVANADVYVRSEALVATCLNPEDPDTCCYRVNLDCEEFNCSITIYNIKFIIL